MRLGWVGLARVKAKNFVVVDYEGTTGLLLDKGDVEGLELCQ